MNMVLTVAAKPNLLSCNFPTLITKQSIQPHKTTTFTSKCCFRQLTSSFKPLLLNKPHFATSFPRKASIIICKDSNKDSEVKLKPVEEEEEGGKRDWTTSILLFLLWAALIYYVSFLSPNQTPVICFFFLSTIRTLLESSICLCFFF
jgi:hypothetical protein